MIISKKAKKKKNISKKEDLTYILLQTIFNVVGVVVRIWA